MAQVPFQMPLRGTPNAPKFSGKMPSELPRYLEDIDLLGDAAVLDEAQKIKANICYAALDEAEVWQTLPEETANPADWADFVAATKKLYPVLQSFFLIVPLYFSFLLIAYLLGEVDTVTPILQSFSFAPHLRSVSLTFLWT